MSQSQYICDQVEQLRREFIRNIALLAGPKFWVEVDLRLHPRGVGEFPLAHEALACGWRQRLLSQDAVTTTYMIESPRDADLVSCTSIFLRVASAPKVDTPTEVPAMAA